MNFDLNLKRIQNLPMDVRVKIMWALVVIVAIGLVTLWSSGIGRQIKNIKTSELPAFNSQNSVNSPAKYVNVEWVEEEGTQTKIYFKINNDSNNILNVSKLENISLKYNDTESKATTLTDRQGNAFVQKVLNYTTIFGIAVFENIAEEQVEMKFDQLFFENDETGGIFNETFELNLKQLNKPLEIRS